jgi:protein-disulfide isomerase
LSSSRKPRSRQEPATRRERREAQRQAARATARRQSGGLPIAWLTGGVVIAVAAVIVILVLVNQSPTGASVAAPTVLTPTGDASGRTVGSTSASVTLDLWADFQCPVCKQFTDTVEPNLMSNYVSTGKVRLVFDNFAFIGPESTQAAIGGLCAADQGKFWPYHDYVYANQGSENSGALSDSTLKAIANAVGLDGGTFSSCLGSSTNREEVQGEADQAQAKGITGTPTLFVNGTKVSNPLDYGTVSAAIDAALGSAPTAPSASG